MFGCEEHLLSVYISITEGHGDGRKTVCKNELESSTHSSTTRTSHTRYRYKSVAIFAQAPALRLKHCAYAQSSKACGGGQHLKAALQTQIWHCMQDPTRPREFQRTTSPALNQFLRTIKVVICWLRWRANAFRPGARVGA